MFLRRDLRHWADYFAHTAPDWRSPLQNACVVVDFLAHSGKVRSAASIARYGPGMSMASLTVSVGQLHARLSNHIRYALVFGVDERQELVGS